MQFKKLIYTSLCLLLFNTISIAEIIDKNEFSKTQAVIESQLKAFINEDAEGAFFHASPYIKMRFNNPQDFMSMVKNYYEPVYNPKNYYFMESKFFEGAIYHQLQIVSQDNVSYLAMYSLIKDKGEWKISGCSIYPMEKQSI